MTGIALALVLAQTDGVEFFEKRIRPVLADKCFSCHSAQAKKLKGSLLLDTRAGVLKGGDLGPAVVPGDPAKSLLLKALSWTDEDLKMPPKEKLPEATIADFAAWVKMGAPDPRTGEAKVARGPGMSVEEGRAFWAFRPVEPRPGDIDGFIRAGLEAKGLKPAPPAARDVLIRRLYYDLAGLPPSPEEVDAFVRDGNVEALVDRLLASPRFGERWGRHWLDVARYAESLTLRGFIFKEAWRYRDYVIDSFNADVPFDRFLREQVAGDLMEGGTMEERRRRRIALTFLAMGNTNLEEQDKKQLEMDYVDEQLETIGRGILAQTITCARCHDHKFDPIPTRDYYAMAGILKNARGLEHANVSKWLEDPLPAEPGREAEARKHEAAVAALEARIKAEKGKAAPAAGAKVSGVLAVADVAGVVVDDAQAVKVGDWQHSTHSGSYIGSGYLHDRQEGKGSKSLTFQPELAAGKYEVRFAYSQGTSRSAAVPVTILSADGEKDVVVNEQEAPPIEGRFVSLGQFRFENNQGYVIVSNEGTKGHVTADAMVFLPVEKIEAAGQAAAKQGGSVKELEAELKKLQESGPRREMAMGVREEKKAADLRIHHRGNVHTLGEVAPRGFLSVAVPGAVPPMPADRSGRKELADWLAGRDNPLTARVFVNRAWHWLFGAGIVRTPDNFGTTGERPSHPELLDHLAAKFVADGGSVKRLVRTIVLSETYRRGAGAAEADPENRLFGRANRRRMDAESIRDAILAAAGTLKLEGAGGPTWPSTLNSDYGYRHAGTQRGVYVPVFRNALPELFEVFDFADTSVSTGRRETSTVAPQALYLMNSPFVQEQAGHAAARLLREPGLDDGGRAARAWRWTLGRAPTESEAAVARKHVGGSKDAAQGWAAVFQALFASVEFRYVN